METRQEASKMTLFDCTGNLLRYRCSCNFQTNILVHLRQHIKENHKMKFDREIRPYTCPCSLKTYSQLLILHHRVSDKCSTKILQLKCDDCSFETNRKFTLSNHILRKHTDFSKIQWHACEQCTKKFKLKDALERHVKFAHSNKPEWFKCNQCAFVTKWKSSFTEHTLRKHTNSSEIYWYRCPQCPKKYKIHNDLKTHVYTIHSKQQRAKCEQCKFQTKWTHDLKYHILIKHTNLPETQWHVCEQCPKRYKTKPSLLRHVSCTHPKELQLLKCEHCNYETRWNHSLSDHILRKHTELSEIQWHMCEQCPKKYKTKSSLMVHLVKAHSKQIHAKFKCEQCTFETKWNRSLTDHILVKHSERSKSQWLLCEHCPKKFKTEVALLRHAMHAHSK